MIRTCLMIAASLAAVPALAAERRFDATGFTTVGVAGSDNVTIRQGSGFAVVATGAQDDLDKIEVRVEKGQLKIGRKRGSWSWGSGKPVTIAVTLPALHGLALSGSADVQADKGSGETFQASLSGSGNLMLASLDTRTATVAISGSGNVKMAGRCGALNVRVAGSGDADLSGLACTNAAISVAGSGDVLARASGQADVRIAGSGDVTVTGGATCSKRVAGSGEVVCR